MLIGFIMIGIMTGTFGAGYVVLVHDAGLLGALAAYSAIGTAGTMLAIAAKLLCVARKSRSPARAAIGRTAA